MRSSVPAMSTATGIQVSPSALQRTVDVVPSGAALSPCSHDTTTSWSTSATVTAPISGGVGSHRDRVDHDPLDHELDGDAPRRAGRATARRTASP